jgi:DNA polymerase elongation subunit (family B)
MSYRNIFYSSRNSSIILWTWDENGKRIKIENSFEPYLYVESLTWDGPGQATSIFNTNLKKITFRTSYERYKFVNETSIVRLFHNIGIEQQYLLDTFKTTVDSPEFAQNPLKIWYLDIEVYAKDEFPTADKAKYPINLITIYDSLDETFYTWGLKPYNAKNTNVKYTYCRSERDLLLNFLSFMKKDYPDIITGWNIEQFDIPYIINRYINVFDKEKAQELSPVSSLFYREAIAEKFGKTLGRWIIHGLSCIDYLEAYRTFTPGEKESYSLNFISELELGEGKLAINATNLANLSETDWENFVDYNIQDVDLVVRLEEKRNILKLVRILAYKGLTQFERALGKVSIVTGAVALQAAKQGYIIPTFKSNKVRDEFNGGFVKEPDKGLRKAVVSYDANSLYPSVILSLNISPETKIGKIVDKTEEDVTIRLANGKDVKLSNEKFTKLLQKEQLSVSKYKVLYTQKFKGVVPNLIDRLYKERVEAKNISLKYKADIERYHQDPTSMPSFDEDKAELLAEQYDTYQLTFKILLNSIYGIFAQKQSPFFDIDHAASVTVTGQAVVKQASVIVDDYLKSSYKTTKPTTIYNDTDSLYLTLEEACALKKINVCSSDSKVTPEMHSLVKELDQELNQKIKQWAVVALNSKDPRFVFKREVICDAGIFLRKKRYILHVLDQEGVPKNKFKYVGVEIARSSTPLVIKGFIKRVLETAMLTEDSIESNKVFRKIYEEFKSLPVEDIAIRKNVKEYEKYAKLATNYSIGKRTPIHVKSSIHYNQLLERLGIDTKYEPIQSGNKIKYFYTAPNKYNIKSIAFTNYYPEELADIKVDYEEMFTKIVTPLLQSVYEAMEWRLPNLTHETQTDLFDLFKL